MHKVVYLPLAEADIMGAVDYIAFTLESPSAAESLLADIDKTAQLLSQFPYSFELYRTNRPMKDDIRKVTVKNYVLYYAVFEDIVEVRRFLHGRRDRSKSSLFE